MSDDLDESIDHDFFDLGDEKNQRSRDWRDHSPDRHRSSPDKHRSEGKQNGGGGEWTSLVTGSARSTGSTGSKREIKTKIPTGTPREDDFDYSSDEDLLEIIKQSRNDRKNTDNKQKHATRDDSPKATDKPRRNLKSAGPRRLSPRQDKRPKDPSPRRDKDKRGDWKNKKGRGGESGSESDSDYSYSSYTSSSDYTSYTDSESEITDVSPLSSPQGSPRRQRRSKKTGSEDPEQTHSPVESPKRVTLGGKPPARPLSAKRSPRHKDFVQYSGMTPNGQRDALMHSTDNRDLSLLLRAVLELDESAKQTLRQGISESSAQKVLFQPEKPQPQNRKNLSFSNDRVRQIDSENQRLLRNILKNTKPKPKKKPVEPQPVMLSHAALNRARQQRRIERENFEMLKRIERQKATRYLQRDTLLKEHDKQLTFGLQVARTGERPASAKKSRSTAKVYTQSMGSRTSSISSLQSQGLRSTSGSRPTSAKKPPEKAKPAWEDRW